MFKQPERSLRPSRARTSNSTSSSLDREYHQHLLALASQLLQDKEFAQVFQLLVDKVCHLAADVRYWQILAQACLRLSEQESGQQQQQQQQQQSGVNQTESRAVRGGDVRAAARRCCLLGLWLFPTDELLLQTRREQCEQDADEPTLHLRMLRLMEFEHHPLRWENRLQQFMQLRSVHQPQRGFDLMCSYFVMKYGVGDAASLQRLTSQQIGHCVREVKVVADELRADNQLALAEQILQLGARITDYDATLLPYLYDTQLQLQHAIDAVKTFLVGSKQNNRTAEQWLEVAELLLRQKLFPHAFLLLLKAYEMSENLDVLHRIQSEILPHLYDVPRSMLARLAVFESLERKPPPSQPR